jgi:hypothetical protein
MRYNTEYQRIKSIFIIHYSTDLRNFISTYGGLR